MAGVVHVVVQGQWAHLTDVVLVPATTALYRLAPPAFLAGYTFHFKVKQQLDEAKLKSQLTLAGYTHVTQVVSPGEYAVRGTTDLGLQKDHIVRLSFTVTGGEMWFVHPPEE